MRPSHAIFALVVLCLVFAWMLTSSGTGDAAPGLDEVLELAPADPGSDLSSNERDLVDAMAAERASKAEARVDVHSVARTGPRFFARLVDRNGDPLPGRLVEARHYPDSSYADPVSFSRYSGPPAEGIKVLPSTKTAADGSFDLPRPSSGFLVLALRGQRESLPADRCYFAGGHAKLHAGDIVCTRNVGLRGRVVDSKSGAPISAARIRAYHMRGSSAARSDADGAFEMRDIAGSTSFVAADAPGYRISHIDAPKDPSASLRIALTRAAECHVRVVDVHGAAIRTARVSIATSFESVQAPFDPGGYFRALRKDAGALTGQVHAPGYASKWIRVPKGKNEATIVLPKMCRVTGRLRDDTGQAIGGVLLRFTRAGQQSTAVAHDGFVQRRIEARTAHDGSFGLELEPGEYKAAAQGVTCLLDDGRERETSQLEIGGEQRHLSLRIRGSTQVLALQVFGRSETRPTRALAHAVVEIPIGISHLQARCDADGMVRRTLTQAHPPKTLSSRLAFRRVSRPIRIRAATYGDKVVEFDELLRRAKQRGKSMAEEPLRVTLEPEARLLIQCRDRRNAPLRACTIYAWHERKKVDDFRLDKSWASDSRGSCEARGLASGSWTLRLAKQGDSFSQSSIYSNAPRSLASSELRVHLSAGETRRLVLRDRTPPTLRIRATRHGKPVQRAAVKLTPLAGGETTHSGTILGGRAAEFTALPPGRYRAALTPREPGFAFLSPIVVHALPPEQSHEIQIAGGSLLLRFRAPAPPGSELTLRRGPTRSRIPIAGRRELRVETLPPGEYQVSQGDNTLLRFRIRDTEQIARDIDLTGK